MASHARSKLLTRFEVNVNIERSEMVLGEGFEPP